MPRRSSLATKFSSLLRRCRHLSATKPGQQTHTQSLTHGLFTDPTLLTDLILMDSRCSHPNLARQLCDQMPHRTMRSWNILISSYVQSSLYHQALSLSSELLSSNTIPDHFILPPLFKACAAMKCISYGTGLHCWVIRLGLDAHIVLMTSVLGMHVKLECTGDACNVFDEMPEKDTVVWSSMIVGFARAGLLAEAMDLFRRLQCEGGETDAMVIPSLLSVCGKSGEFEDGKGSAWENDSLLIV